MATHPSLARQKFAFFETPAYWAARSWLVDNILMRIAQHELNPQAKETACIKICKVIRRAKRPSSNVTKDEREAWKKLKKNKALQISQADKGNATIVLDAADYDAKVHELLDDCTFYDRLKKDPTRATDRKFLDVIRDLKKGRKFLTVSTKKFVRRKYQANRPFFMDALSCTRRESHWDRSLLPAGRQLMN